MVVNRPRMLHAAELERGDEDEIEFSEWIRNARVRLQPAQRFGVPLENCFPVARDLCFVAFAMKHAKSPAVVFSGFDPELAGREREKVRRYQLRLRSLFRVAEGLPSGRKRQIKAVTRFEIRLIETGKSKV